MKWQYDEVLRGNTYHGFVMDGIRVVASVRHTLRVPLHADLTSIADSDQDVVRSRKELWGIVKRHSEAAEAAGEE